MKKYAIFIIVLILIGTGCVKISDRSFSDFSDRQITLETFHDESAEVSNAEIYHTYTFTKEDENYLETCLFIGDFICGGFLSHNLIREEQVIWDDEAGIYNISSQKLNFLGEEIDALTAVINSKEKDVIICLGANDVIYSDSTMFYEHLTQFLKLLTSYAPETDFILLSIPPAAKSDDTDLNSEISEFNLVMKAAMDELHTENVFFLDIGTEIVNNDGYIKSNYIGSDGLLTKSAYHAILWEICNF